VGGAYTTIAVCATRKRRTSPKCFPSLVDNEHCRWIPSPLTVAPAMLIAATRLACWLPARRAVKVDPITVDTPVAFPGSPTAKQPTLFRGERAWHAGCEEPSALNGGRVQASDFMTEDQESAVCRLFAENTARMGLLSRLSGRVPIRGSSGKGSRSGRPGKRARVGKSKVSSCKVGRSFPEAVDASPQCQGNWSGWFHCRTTQKGDSPYALGPRPSSDSRPSTQTRSRRPVELTRLPRGVQKPLRAKGSANG
jgi:hypothetical protein